MQDSCKMTEILQESCKMTPILQDSCKKSARILQDLCFFPTRVDIITRNTHKKKLPSQFLWLNFIESALSFAYDDHFCYTEIEYDRKMAKSVGTNIKPSRRYDTTPKLIDGGYDFVLTLRNRSFVTWSKITNPKFWNGADLKPDPANLELFQGHILRFYEWPCLTNLGLFYSDEMRFQRHWVQKTPQCFLFSETAFLVGKIKKGDIMLHCSNLQTAFPMAIFS